MEERLIHLKVKIKNLADEARTIREEARKTSGMVKWGLNHHRKTVVRGAARTNLLAYGLLRGIPYAIIEIKSVEAPDFREVLKTAKRFGGDEKESLEWVEEAKAYFKAQKKNEHGSYVPQRETPQTAHMS